MKTIAANDRQPATSQAHSNTKSAGGSRLMDSLCNSVTLSLIEAPWWIAMLTLVFSGPLANYLGQASIYLIAGAVVSMTIVSFFSSWKGVIWIPQDVPTAIIVLITGKMLSDMPDTVSMDSQFATVIVAIGITSMLTGLGMYLVGALQLGKWITLLPMPVIAGFLGGTGCLLLLGGISSTLGELGTANLFTLEKLMRWVPCVALALIIYGAGRYTKHALLIPASMLVAALLFFAISQLSGTPMSALQAGGWLFEKLAVSESSGLLTSEQIGSVQWSMIFAQTPHMLILVAASVVSMLLNNSGFELYVGGKFDHDKDLRTTGIANLLAGLVGGWPGYMSPAWSSLNAKQGRQLPFTGILVAVLSGLILWCASDFLAYIPRFVIGSAVAYVGVCFLFDWVIGPAKRLSWGEFAGLIGVMAVVVGFGV